MMLVASLLASQSLPADREFSANDLARRVITHEWKAQDEDHSHWMYRQVIEDHGKVEVREVIETKDGDLSRLLAVNGRPLSEDEQQREDERIQKLIANPDEHRKSQRARNEDGDEAERLLKLFPEASLFSFVQQRGDVVELEFRPNPRFKPPSPEAHVFHEMDGHIKVNVKEDRLVEIAGHLSRDVKFGGGLLGHLDKGGWFTVRQAEVAPTHWEMTLLDVNMKGKILFFKTISLQQREYRSDFHRVPDNLTLADAAEILRKQIRLAARR